MDSQNILPSRFLPSSDWTSEEFINPNNYHKIHYAYALPQEKTKGVIVTLPGLSEFGEKYIETANFFLKHGYAFYVIDWAYQGRSTRFKNNTHKRHSDGYEQDISDLHYLISNEIKTELPLLMLAHSMGGNIGLRYLLKHPSIFKAASFSAPMLGIHDLKNLYCPVSILLKILAPINTFYVPNGKNWYYDSRKNDGTDIFSSDPIRDKIHNTWSQSNTALQVGNPTLKWLSESLKSIKILKNSDNLSQIKIPTLLACGDKETLIDREAIKRATRYIPQAQHLDLKNGKHEILMETDDVRNLFLEETLKLFNQ